MSEGFRFKNFSIKQDRCAMKVGTDGVLLGAWAIGGARVLDIGSGTGLIALMMAQRFPEAFVDGVEIDHDAALQSMENVAESPFADRIRIYESALQDFRPSAMYDAIVTNPPFYSHHLASPDAARKMARQADTLHFTDILNFAKQWLEQDGELSAVLPVESADEFSEAAFLRGFFISRLWKVRTVRRKPPKRCLIAFSKTRPQSYDSGDALMLEDNGSKSLWYKTLTADFYLD